MKHKLFIIAGALVVAGAAVGGDLYYVYPVEVSTIAGMTRNSFISWSAPPGTIAPELNPAYKPAAATAPAAPATAPSPNAVSDWPSYNRTLTSERYSQLDQINTKNVGKLKVLCTYDVNQYTCARSSASALGRASSRTVRCLSPPSQIVFKAQLGIPIRPPISAEKQANRLRFSSGFLYTALQAS